MRNDCPSCDATIKDLGKEKRELKRLLNEANTRIEMMSEPKVAPKAHSEFCECNTCTVMRVNSKLWDQIHEMDAQIAVYRDALENMMTASCEMANCGVCSYAKKVLDSQPASELLERVKKYQELEKAVILIHPHPSPNTKCIVCIALKALKEKP